MAAVTGHGGRPRQHDRSPVAQGYEPHRHRAPGLAACLTALLLPAITAAAAPTPLPLEGPSASQDYPHTERIEQVVTLDGFGRYAFEAEGEQPVRVQLVDRMAGPGPVHTGRTDRFLDRGRVKVVLRGQARGTGDIRLTAHRFSEANGEDLPRLPEQRLVETQLHDYQRRSYWIEVSSRRWVSIEAGGRYLADLRLWRDGRWLSAAEPSREVQAPVTGQPLEIRRIHARLEPGLYRLSAYGGPGNPWSTDTQDAPLYLRMGIPELPAEGWSVLEASPFGVDRWRLHSNANVFQLELPEARPASLRVSPLAEGASPYRPGGAGAAHIDKDSRDPAATVVTGGGTDHRRDVLVTVERAPGEEYRLAYLRHARRYGLPVSASAWLGTAAIGDPRDSIDATAIIVNDRPGRRPVVKAARAVELSTSSAWRRRFNLLDTVDLLVEVKEDGTYVAEVGADSGARVELQIEPLDRTAARNFRTRWDVASEARWDLVKGFYRVSMRPRHGDAGIAEVSLHHTAAPPDSLAGPTLPPRQASAVFEGVRLDRYDYVLANRYNYGRSGLVVRPWPLALDRPLPVTQSAGNTRRFLVRGQGDREVIAETPSGKRLPLSATLGGTTRESMPVRGRTEVFVANDGEEPLRYLLRWAPEPEAPPPPLKIVSGAEVRRSLPDFPVIEPGAPARLNLGRQAQATYKLAVDAPALYRLETTGLLSTAGRLRTRTITSLAAANDNGVGRNFLIQRYLGSGDYQLTVQANGRSAGPLGVSLARTPLREAGALPLDGAVRTTVEPGGAVRYSLDIAEAGRYRIDARGLKQPFDIQLDGPDGWPVIQPGRRTPLTLNLRPGRHTLTVLPQSVAARAVTTVARTDTAAAPLEGHGPHALPLNRARDHTWMEPADEGAPRTPDQWRFDLAAAMHVRLSLPAGMDATLLRRGDDGWRAVPEAAAAARAGWRELEAGGYRLDVRSRRPDNGLDYRVRLATLELPVGQSRAVTAPAQIPFVLERSRLVKISALGGDDVAAALTTAGGERLAFSDDRPDDWNFLISRHLGAGRYSLAVTAPGGRAETTVTLDAPAETTGERQRPDSDIRVADGDVHVYPLELPAADRVPSFGLPLVFASRSAGTHGVALERRDGDTWRTLTTRTGRQVRGGVVLTADTVGRAHRLRVWSLDSVPRDIDVALRLGTNAPKSLGMNGALRGRLAGLPDAEAALGLALLKRPGPLHVNTRPTGLLWGTADGAFEPVREGWVPAAGRGVWLLGPRALETLSAEVVALAPGTVRNMPTSPSRPLPLRTGGDTGRLRLWIAASTAGMPELRTTSAATTAAPRTAVALALPGGDREDVGLALRLADADGDAPVTVSAHALATGDAVSVKAGSTQLTVPAETAVKVSGPAGPAEIALAAPARVAGALLSGTDISRLLWTGEAPRKLHTRATVDTIWLANPTREPATVSLGWAPADADAALAPGQFGRYTPGFSGTLSLAIRPGPGFAGSIHVAGAVRGLRFVGDDGAAVIPTDSTGSLEITGPGILHVDHAAGAFGVWLAGADGLTGWRRTIDLNPQAPALLSLRGSRPTLIGVERPDGSTQLRWLESGRGIDTLLPAGRNRLRTMGAAPQMALTPPSPMPAGLGEVVRLGPNEARVFTFTLEELRTVGLGFKADREVVRGILVDEGGRRLGEGIVQMHRLEPGRYYLIAHLPADAPPTAVQPALVGTEAPGDEPPQRIRERYRRLAGEE